ncbi:hypothetical protein VSWAT3_02676, partial [Vibrionales bacterium SWAT-3]
AHIFDILFVDNSPRSYYASDLSGHMQRDIGVNR